MTIVNSSQLLCEFKKATAASSKIRIAIAFWGSGAIEAFGLDSSHDIEVICNLKMGGTDPREIERLIERGIKVFPHDTLHAKMAVMDSFGFIGSSNASTNGLGLQSSVSREWEELNVLFSQPQDIALLNEKFALLKSQAGSSLTQSDNRLKEAYLWWKKRQSLISRTTGDQPKSGLIESFKGDQNPYKDGNVYVVIHIPPNAEDSNLINNEREEIQSEFGKNYDTYYNWGDLPSDSTLIDFGLNENGWEYGGLWKRTNLNRKKIFQSVEEEKNILGKSKIKKEDKIYLKKTIEKYWSSLKGSKRRSQYIDLYNLITEYGP